jgi:hypothetical protein
LEALPLLVQHELAALLAESDRSVVHRLSLDVSRALASFKSLQDTVQMLLPVAVPYILDEHDTVARALGVPRWLLPGSSPAVVALCIASPMTLMLSAAALVGAVSPAAAISVAIPTALATGARQLLGCRAVARPVLQTFDVIYPLVTAVVAASCGGKLLAHEPGLAALWVLAHCTLGTAPHSDALPQNAAGSRLARTERVAFFPAFAAFSVFALWLLHSKRFPGRDVPLPLLGDGSSLWQATLSVQIQLSFLSCTLALRSLRRGQRGSRLIMRNSLRRLQVSAARTDDI